MKCYKAFQFRMQPNKEQQTLISKTFGCARLVYNKMLADKIAYYKLHREMLRITPAAYKDEFEWLREVDSLALCSEQRFLESAF
ncbi:MAG: helix-turn-helix domain-containing protein, partial [Eubacteriaceae bacterium]|nr:helix-turn-helix domain-containing protein [Eubacteriaceae bacterium]